MQKHSKRLLDKRMHCGLRRVLAVIVWGLSICVTAHDALACEPCHAPTLKEAWAQADLVVVANRVPLAKGVLPPLPMVCPLEDPSLNHTEIEIKRVLKGALELKRLKVRACYGMCDYGLILSDFEPRLIFLQKRSSGADFETLSLCKAPELPVREGKVQVGESWILLDEALSK